MIQTKSLKIYVRFVTKLTAYILSITFIFSCKSKDNDDSSELIALALVSNNSNSISIPCTNKNFCKIFITAGNATVTSGIAGLDANCANDANKPSGGGTYKALAVDGINRIACTSLSCITGGTSEHSNWVLKASKQYRRVDETTIIGTTTSKGVFSFPLDNSFNSGSIGGIQRAITGMTEGWLDLSTDCNNYTTTVSWQVHYGNITSKTDTSIHDTYIDCDQPMKVICIEQ